MIRNWYNQIPHPALKTKREITKYINWRQFTKGTRGQRNIKSEMRSFKSNENIHKKEGGSYYVVSANKASSVAL